jgi:hypothetical protein
MFVLKITCTCSKLLTCPTSFFIIMSRPWLIVTVMTSAPFDTLRYSGCRCHNRLKYSSKIIYTRQPFSLQTSGLENRIRDFFPTGRNDRLNSSIQRGTSTWPSSRWMTASASKPSISASGFRSSRWRKTAGTTNLTSSGVTYARPCKAA